VLSTKAALHSSEHEPPSEVHDTAQLDAELDRIAAGCPPTRPTIVDLQVHHHSVTFGLGLPETFVQIRSDSGMPYFITVGDPNAIGVVTYYFMGDHHTEILRRHHVNSVIGREIVREFFTTGQRPMRVSWEEV
jgi:hypothetical protein